ncbi:MAG: divalent-cation tolerance protein CutA [Candidatus Thorarchaeota archaeon]
MALPELANMLEYIVAMSTCPTSKAEEIALSLVKKRLCACVNILPKVLSYYYWKGEIEKDAESLLLIKTEEEMKEPLLEALRSVHPYDMPEFIVVPVNWGASEYLDWITGNVRHED